MWQFAINRLNSRAIVSGALIAVLVMSLTCSMSMQYGHADTPVANSADQVRPLEAGESAPQFVVRTVDNEHYVFDPRGLEQPVVLITFRGGWCPYCNMHLSELKDIIADIDALGVDVLFLSGDRPEMLYQSLSRETQEDIEGLGYTILSDADAQAAIALGIAFRASQQTIDRRFAKEQDIADSSMLRHGVLAVPSVFAIDRDGQVAYVYSNPDYRVRLPAGELLQKVQELAAIK